MKTTEKIVELAHDKELAQMAIAHIIKKNKCGSEDLMQLAEAIPGAIQYAANWFEIDLSEVRERIESLNINDLFLGVWYGLETKNLYSVYSEAIDNTDFENNFDSEPILAQLKESLLDKCKLTEFPIGTKLKLEVVKLDRDDFVKNRVRLMLSVKL